MNISESISLSSKDKMAIDKVLEKEFVTFNSLFDVLKLIGK